MRTGQLIKELRLKKGITQEDLAAQTDINVRTIQRIENDDVDPRAYTLQSIATASELDFAVLANDKEELNTVNEEGNSRWLPLLHLSGLLLLILPLALLFVPPILIVLALFSQVVIIINSLKVTSHPAYQYPLSIRFLKQESPV